MRYIYKYYFILLIVLGFASIKDCYSNEYTKIDTTWYKYKDYALKYKDVLLLRMGFDVDDMVFVKDSSATYYGKTIPIKNYIVKIKCLVNTSSLSPSELPKNLIKDSAYAFFSFNIGHDSDYTIHDEFVKTIYSYWKSKDSAYIEDYTALPNEYGIFYKEGDYLLFNHKYIRWVPWTIWFNKRIIDINVLGFENDKRGGLSADILLTSMIFEVEGVNDFVYTCCMHSFPPDDIIRLYEGGKFKKRRWIDRYYENHKYLDIN